MVAKKTRKSSRKVKMLRAKNLTAKQAKSVKGGGRSASIVSKINDKW